MTSPSPEKPPRKVLIVSPHFPPINTPDMQRVRIALTYFRRLGWEPVVLAVAPDMVEGGVLEPLLELTYPPDIRIIRARGISARYTRWAGIGSLWLRCGRAIRLDGEKLLRGEHFDLVFFSTTQFDAFALGPRWRAKFGVPYVLDYQDPWINDYYSRSRVRPPGGWLKFGYSQWCARRKEPKALRGASGIIAVSGAYGATLARTYPWFDAKDVVFLPFGAAEADFVAARLHKPAEPLVSFGDGFLHFVYTGRCGPDMSTALRILFRAFKRFLSSRPDQAKLIRFHFIGTDYAPRPLGREWAMPVAREEGVGEFVSEQCYRVPYYDALYYLEHADALMAIGSNDPTYSASKIFPYVLARRPMLVIFHDESPVLALAEAMKCGSRYSFHDAEQIDTIAARVEEEWFLSGKMKEFIEPDLSAFHPYSAESMTQRLTECFEKAIERSKSTQ